MPIPKNGLRAIRKRLSGQIPYRRFPASYAFLWIARHPDIEPFVQAAAMPDIDATAGLFFILSSFSSR